MMPGMPLTSTVQMTEISGSSAIRKAAHHQAGGQFVLGLAGAFHDRAPADQAGGEEHGGDDAPAEGLKPISARMAAAEDQCDGQDQRTGRTGQLALGECGRLRTGVRVEVI